MRAYADHHRPAGIVASEDGKACALDRRAGETARRAYRPPAPEVFVPAFSAWPAALARPAPPAKLLVAERPTVH
ncbi:hypothetical protein FV230_02675 [Methylobacterium sp. WL6]|nr:hypothetical protein FV230_02675 [Methylobacterium sp. WL6]